MKRWQRWERWSDIEIFKTVTDAGIAGQRIIRELKYHKTKPAYRPGKKARTIYYVLKEPADQKAPFTKEMLKVQKIVLHFYDDKGTKIKDKTVFPYAKASEDSLPDSSDVPVEGKEVWGDGTGKPANGLQLKILVRNPETLIKADGSGTEWVDLDVTFKNVGKKPLKLDAFLPWTRHFVVEFLKPDGRSATRLPQGLTRSVRSPSVKELPELGPGESYNISGRIGGTPLSTYSSFFCPFTKPGR